MRFLCCGLMSPPPERPCDDVGRLNSFLRETLGYAADFLDRPTDEVGHREGDIVTVFCRDCRAYLRGASVWSDAPPLSAGPVCRRACFIIRHAISIAADRSSVHVPPAPPDPASPECRPSSASQRISLRKGRSRRRPRVVTRRKQGPIQFWKTTQQSSFWERFMCPKTGEIGFAFQL